MMLSCVVYCIHICVQFVCDVNLDRLGVRLDLDEVI